jgi:hypothetical protein
LQFDAGLSKGEVGLVSGASTINPQKNPTMKTLKTPIGLILAVSQILVGTCVALTPVADDFNAAGKGDDAGVGFWIFNADDPGDVIFFEFYGNPGKTKRESVCACFVTDGQHLAGELTLKQKAATQGRLKINYSAKTRSFTFYFRKNAKGAAWAQMGSFSVNGVGGDVRANWNMNPGSGRFGIRLEGYSEKKAVAAGDLTMDNFVLQAAN